MDIVIAVDSLGKGAIRHHPDTLMYSLNVTAEHAEQSDTNTNSLSDLDMLYELCHLASISHTLLT